MESARYAGLMKTNARTADFDDNAVLKKSKLSSNCSLSLQGLPEPSPELDIVIAALIPEEPATPRRILI